MRESKENGGLSDTACEKSSETEFCEDSSVVHPRSAAARSSRFIHSVLRPEQEKQKDMNGSWAGLTGVFVSGSHLN